MTISCHYPDLDKLVPSYVREFEPYITSKPDHERKKMYALPFEQQ